MRNPAVIALIAANAVAYLFERSYPGFEVLFALWPWQSGGGPSYFHSWQIVTYAFLHDPASLAHIIFNMLGVYMFGSAIESYAGAARFTACYFASVITAALAQLIIPPLLGTPGAPAEGASGGVFGLLLAYALLFPHRKVVPLIPPIPMPAWLFATLYAGAELFFGVTGTLSGIAHFAHLGGMIGSAIVMLGWRPRSSAPS